MLEVQLTQKQYEMYHKVLAEVWEENDKDLAPYAMELFIRCCETRGVEV